MSRRPGLGRDAALRIGPNISRSQRLNLFGKSYPLDRYLMENIGNEEKATAFIHASNRAHDLAERYSPTYSREVEKRLSEKEKVRRSRADRI